MAIPWNQKAKVNLSFDDGSQLDFDAYITDIKVEQSFVDISSMGGRSERIPTGQREMSVSMKSTSEVLMIDTATEGQAIASRAERLLRRLDT
jgi:hypothetical protein